MRIWSRRARFGVRVGVALAVFVAIGTVGMLDVTAFMEGQQRVARTLDVTQALVTFEGAVQTAENAYHKAPVLLGPDLPTMRDPFENAIERPDGVRVALGALRTVLGSADRDGRTHVNEIERLTATWLTDADLTRTGAPPVANAPDADVDSMMRAVRTVRAEADTRLRREADDVASRAWWLGLLMVIGGALSVGLLTIAFVGADREVGERRRAEASLRSLNTKLDARVAERTAAARAAQSAVERQLARLTSLRRIDEAILGTTSLKLALDRVLEETTSRLQVDAANVFLLNTEMQQLELVGSRGFSKASKNLVLRLGQGVAGRAALERRTVAVPNLAEDTGASARPSLMIEEGFKALYGVPLLAHGRLVGVLDVFHRAPLSPDPEWLEYLETLAGQAAIAVQVSRTFEELERSNLGLSLAYETTIEGWSRALDLRDHVTEGHTARVTEMTMRLGRAAGIDGAQLVHLRRGALLHDIGKMAIPDAVLHKAGSLTDAEREVMRQHPIHAFELLSPIPFLAPALEIPYCHHEWWDGSGYPRGLRGQQIPVAARLFAIADVWDAVTSARPYHSPWPAAEAERYIRGQAGIQFDPALVDLFLRTILPSDTLEPQTAA